MQWDWAWPVPPGWKARGRSQGTWGCGAGVAGEGCGPRGLQTVLGEAEGTAHAPRGRPRRAGGNCACASGRHAPPTADAIFEAISGTEGNRKGVRCRGDGSAAGCEVPSVCNSCVGDRSELDGRSCSPGRALCAVVKSPPFHVVHFASPAPGVAGCGGFREAGVARRSPEGRRRAPRARSGLRRWRAARVLVGAGPRPLPWVKPRPLCGAAALGSGSVSRAVWFHTQTGVSAAARPSGEHTCV